MTNIRDILVLPEKTGLPLDLRRGAGGSRVFFEIGFGNGEYLVHLAGKDPSSRFWGIEMSRSCVLRALRRAARAGVENVALMCGDARFILRECVEPCSVDGIYMNFPCPWPKKRHSKKRLSGDGFPSEMARALKAGAFFELMTDEEWFALEVRKAFESEGSFSAAEWVENPPRRVTTKYERKWTEMGKSLFLVRLVRREGADDAPLRPREVEEVHIRVPGRGALVPLLQGLYGSGGRDGASVWVFKKCYSSDDGREHLLEVVATDEGFEQKFFLLAVERDDDALVKVAPHSSPFLTPAVKGAAEGVASGIESRRPERGCSP